MRILKFSLSVVGKMLPRPSGIRSNVGAPYSFMFSSFVAAMKGGEVIFTFSDRTFKWIWRVSKWGVAGSKPCWEILPNCWRKKYNSIMFVFRYGKYLRSIFVPFLTVLCIHFYIKQKYSVLQFYTESCKQVNNPFYSTAVKIGKR